MISIVMDYLNRDIIKVDKKVFFKHIKRDMIKIDK